jgi:hypothetical protein
VPLRSNSKTKKIIYVKKSCCVHFHKKNQKLFRAHKIEEISVDLITGGKAVREREAVLGGILGR